MDQTPQDAGDINNTDQLLKHGSVSMQKNGSEGVKEDS